MFRSAKSSARIALPAFLIGAMALYACSATDGEGRKAPKDSSGDQGQGRDGAGASGNGDGPGLDIDDDDGGTGDLDENSACASDKRVGELVPLDVYVMLDRSGSMSSSRWSAVTNALKGFVDSDEAKGIGMGIGYFPVAPPPFCASDADCGALGPCFFGDCMELAELCQPTDYQKPAVSIGVLPIHGSKIKASLDSTKASGGTPTQPALAGAYLYAKQRAKQNPSNTVVVVLATDGEPNECGSNTSGIASIAADALKTSPSVATFVIDVGDDAKSDLNVIAEAGGTDKAIDVSDSNATQEFLDALNKIRGTVACEYRIPAPKDGKEADHDRVNVNVTADGKTETIGRVAAASECDPTKGGWYYDDPKNPSKILLCEKTCQLVKSGSQMAPVEVEVLLGCKSKVW